MHHVRPQRQHFDPPQHYGRKYSTQATQYLRGPTAGTVGNRQQCESNRLLGQRNKGRQQSGTG